MEAESPNNPCPDYWLIFWAIANADALISEVESKPVQWGMSRAEYYRVDTLGDDDGAIFLGVERTPPRPVDSESDDE